jgi:urea transport system substrate-binding protein
MRRRPAVVALVAVAALVLGIAIAELAGAGLFGRLGRLVAGAQPPIVVGLLHSTTGPLEPYERPLLDAEIMALEEINAGGGIAGRMVKWVQADGRSDPRAFAAQARRLIEVEKTSVVIGGWTSECRKAIRPVVEELGSLLVFPAEFEGLEQSPHVAYAGPSANQQVVPSVRWALDSLGSRKPFVLCSDEVWSRTVAAIAMDQLRVSGVGLAGEVAVPLAGADVGPAVAAIAKAQPDLILNFLVGEANTALFPALRKAGIRADRCPAISFRVSEEDGRRIVAEDLAGHYVACDYLSTVDSPSGRDFARRFRARFGDDRTVSAPVAAAYGAALLWARAAEQAGDPAPSRVIARLPRLSLDAPEGVVTIDPEGLASWRPSLVARARPDGQFDVAWSIERPIRPLAYTSTRSRGQWAGFLDDLRSGWRGGWSGEGKPPAGPPPG